MQPLTWAPDTCICPPELDDLALIAAIDGEAGPDVAEHLRLCGYCAERAHHYAELQGALRKQFFRMFCPSTDALVAFHDGTLATTEHTHLRDHLAECPHCRRELGFLEQLTTDAGGGRAPPSPYTRQPLASHQQCAHEPAPRLVVAVCTHAHTAPSLSDVPDTPRSSFPNISQYAFQAENVKITIGVRSAANRADLHVVTGSLQLHGDSPTVLHDTIAYLSRAQQQLAAAQFDAPGNFVLDNLIPGTYRLAFRLPDREVIIEAVGL